MSLELLWLQFGAIAVAILIAAQFMARSADAVAEKTGLGRSFVGVVMLATATSLPELGTGVSSIVFVDSPDLAIGDAFGSNLFNLMIIGLADLYWRNGPFLTAVRLTSVTVGALGAGLILLAVGAVYFHNATTVISSWYVSPISVALIVGFLITMMLVYRQEKSDGQTAVAEEEKHEDYADQSLRRAVAVYLASAAVVVASAVLLAETGFQVAEEMNWEASFVGTQFLALSTSLPELATTFAALRLNAPDLAITNLLGSNVFNMGFILFMDDIVYTGGVVWSAVSQVHIAAGLVAVFMTGVVIAGAKMRPRGRLGTVWTPEGIVLVACYIGGNLLVFALG